MGWLLIYISLRIYIYKVLMLIIYFTIHLYIHFLYLPLYNHKHILLYMSVYIST